MHFSYTALNARGEKQVETLEAPDLAQAQQELLKRGLLVLSVEPQRAQRGGAQREARSAPQRSKAAGVRGPELALFARQMSMMLRAGASLVPAVQAIHEQVTRPAWRTLLADLLDRVESGSTLQDAMARYPNAFPPTMRSIIAAGEATGCLADAFARLATLLDARIRLRKKVVGALVYPCVLLLLAINVVITMTYFVLPRFDQLFQMLDTPLPWITRFMLDTSVTMKTWWPVALGAPAALITTLVLWARSAGGRRMIGLALVRVPVIGRVVRGVLLGQLLQAWAALLRSKVPLLDAIQQTRETVSNPAFQALVENIEQSIVQGRQMTTAMKLSGLVPGPILATIATGEESGRLGESMEFVAGWLEAENDDLIAALTRALEPTILILMGVVVGGVCIALFLPLFDIATAAG